MGTQLLHTGTRAHASAPSDRLSRREEMVTLLLGVWVMVGLFVDGWAHRNLAELETFFTPWHGLFYSGFTAYAAWIGWQVLRRQEAGRRGREAVPAGYGPALAGIALFALGGVADGVWHTVFGIEEDLEALFSPTHLVLFVGLVLILSAPLAAAWSSDGDRAPSLSALLPALLSTALVTTLVAFMMMFLSAYDGVGTSAGLSLPFDEVGQIMVVAEVLATTLIVVAPLLVLATRWRLPFGSATLLLTMVAALSSALTEFGAWPLAVAGVAGGVAADAVLLAVGVGPERPGRLWIAGALLPLPLWLAWFLALLLSQPAWGWSPELWTGTIMWAMVVGGAAGLAIRPPLRGSVSPPAL